MKIDRLISIIMLLLERKKVSAPELAEMFEVNLRTIYRDIETINQAGIPIITYRGANGGIGIMEEYKFEKKLFTLSDITELLIGLNNINSTVSNDDLLKIIAKIKGLIPNEEIREVEDKINSIKIDHTPWLGNENTKKSIDMIRTAINKNKLLNFKYFDRLQQKSERTIEPYRLVMKNSRWYVQGYCNLREDYRIFEVSHMISLKALNETFTPRDFDYDNADIYFRTERKNITLKLLIDESLVDLMTEYCGSENVIPCNVESSADNIVYTLDDKRKDKYIAYFPFVEDDYFYNMILNFGNKCECLEPEYIRNNIIHKIQSLVDIYMNSPLS